jgi:hypothetical protein
VRQLVVCHFAARRLHRVYHFSHLPQLSLIYFRVSLLGFLVILIILLLLLIIMAFLLRTYGLAFIDCVDSLSIGYSCLVKSEALSPSLIGSISSYSKLMMY